MTWKRHFDIKNVGILLEEVRAKLCLELARERENAISGGFIPGTSTVSSSFLDEMDYFPYRDTTMDFSSLYPSQMTFANTGGQYETERT